MEEERNESENEEAKKNRLIYIILGSIAFILLIIIIFILISGNGDKKEKETDNKDPNIVNPDNKDEEEKEAPRIPRTENLMYIYNIDGVYIEDSYCTDNKCVDKPNVSIEIGDIDARVLDLYPHKLFGKYEFPEFIVFKDGDKIKSFSIKELRSTTLGIGKDYKNYYSLGYDGKLNAIYYSSKEESGIYSLITNTYMYKNTYDKFEDLDSNTIYGYIKDKKSILALNKEEVMIENADSSSGKIGEFYIKKETISGTDYYSIYSKDNKLIKSKLQEYEYSFVNNKVYIIVGNKVVEYNSSGEEGYNSNTYEKIVRIASSFFIATNNGKVLVVKTLDNEAVLEEDLNGYRVEPSKSGYLLKSYVSNKTGEGVYVVLDDGENIIEYKYDTKIARVLN